METKQLVGSLLATLGRTLGLEGLALDADGTATFRLDDRIMATVAVEEATRSALLFAPLPVPSESAMREALRANFLWRGTGGAKLAIEPATGQLALQYRLPVDGLDYPAFATALELFLNTAGQLLDRSGNGKATHGSMDGELLRLDARLLV